MDRNTFTGLFLIMVIIGASVFFMKPSEADIKKEREKITADSLAKVKASQKEPAVAVTKPADSVKPDTTTLKGPFGGNINGVAETSVLENDILKLTFTNMGGKILSVELKKEVTYTKKPVILFDGKDNNKFGLNINIDGKVLNTNDLYFTKAAQTANSLNQVVQGNNVTLNWETTLLQQEKSHKKEQEHAAPYYKYIEKNPDHLGMGGDKKEELKEGKIEWFSFKQQFFSAVLIPQVPFEKGDLEVKILTDTGKVKWYGANMQLPYTHLAAQNYAMKFYFGDNKFDNLKAQGQEIEKQVDMGYWPLKYINRFVVLPVFQFLESFGWGYGVIILLLTVLLKLAMSPLTYKSYISMAKMRILKPEMDEIKAKVGEDNATLLQQEYLKLYKKVGVNPLGGCLPMLLQLPFVMAFFFFFPNLFELRGESFLWMHDLSTYDDFIKFGFTIPFIGDHLSLMCILMTISTLIYTYFNNQISGATGQMKYIGYIMPIIF
ncbi:MAG: membrane protein insertase YidC, partial [Pedobacter sp.]